MRSSKRCAKRRMGRCVITDKHAHSVGAIPLPRSPTRTHTYTHHDLPGLPVRSQAGLHFPLPQPLSQTTLHSAAIDLYNEKVVPAMLGWKGIGRLSSTRGHSMFFKHQQGGTLRHASAVNPYLATNDVALSMVWKNHGILDREGQFLAGPALIV